MGVEMEVYDHVDFNVTYFIDFRMFQRRQRRHQDNLGVYMLAYQLMSAGPIPPITLGAILIQVRTCLF